MRVATVVMRDECSHPRRHPEATSSAEGTVFKLYFPRLEAAATASLKRSAEFPAGGTETVMLPNAAVKPFNPTTLLRMVREALDRRAPALIGQVGMPVR